jgi:KilA-N domain
MIDTDAELEKMESMFVRREDQYINASILCRTFGKNWRDFVLFEDYSYPLHDFLAALAAEYWIVDPETLIQEIDGEIWIHPNLAIPLGQWLSMSYKLAVSRKVSEASTQEQVIEILKPKAPH